MVKKFSGIPNDIARLAGKRFAAVGEVDDGSRMSESLIKDMTGGDTITARFLRREYFDFKPQFKLWIRGNHEPQIRGTDEGIWRRVHLIPFTVRIPEAQRDPHLSETLRAELPGILVWAVRGALEYHRHGLAVPAKVKRATQAYREEMDVIGEFLTERCVLDKAASVNATELYQAYRGWCEGSGNDAVTQRTFGTRLGARGYTKKSNRRGDQYYGLRLGAEVRIRHFLHGGRWVT